MLLSARTAGPGTAGRREEGSASGPAEPHVALLAGDIEDVVVSLARTALTSSGGGHPMAAHELREPLEATDLRTLARLLDRLALSAEVAGDPPLGSGATMGHARHHEVQAQLLGAVSVSVDGAPVAGWSRGRARSLLAYVLTHRRPPSPNEVLMDAFWPDSSAQAARNSLHVAIHGLRRMLRTATDTPVIVLAGDTYRLDPTVQLHLDVDEFDECVARARDLERRGDRAAAITAYEVAAATYGGDFLAESPYENWAVPIRERLRVRHLHALTRLSSLYFDLDRYESCVGLCRRILEADPCDEDIRRRVMRCHSRLGQPHLALREFRECAAVLTDQLGIAPDPSTAVLRDRISRHERI